MDAGAAPLRVGIVGAGMIARVFYGYLPGTRKLRNVAVTAVASKERAEAEALAREWDIPRVFDSADQLIASGEVDLVVNLTPATAHFEVSCAALDAGLHLVSEKPLALSLADADTLVELSQLRGTVAVCAPMDMLGGEWRTARELVRTGALGTVAFARVHSSHAGAADMGWPTNPAPFYTSGAGALLDLGVYGITRATGVLGPALQVQCLAGITRPRRRVKGGPFDGDEIEVTEADNVIVTLDLGSARFAVIDATYNVLASHAAQMEVYGSEGVLEIGTPGMEPGQQLRQFVNDDARHVAGWITPRSVSPFAEPDPVVEYGRGSLIDHAARCVATGEAPVASLEHARHVLAVMLAAQESAQTGRLVEVSRTFDAQQRPPHQPGRTGADLP